MELNYSCMRAVLMAIEKHVNFNDGLATDHVDFFEMLKKPELSKYSKEDVLYVSTKLEEAGYINFVNKYASNQLYRAYYGFLTYPGHQLLDSIRSDNVWNRTLSIAQKIGAVSIDVLVKIASGVLTNLINTQLGINQ